MGDTPFTKWAVPDGSQEAWLEWSPYTQRDGENAYYPGNYTCAGHGKEDRVLSVKLPFTDSVLAAALAADAGPAGNGDGEISNWEFFLAIDPNDVRGSDMVYDHFRWDHCREESLEQQYVGITTKVVHSTTTATTTTTTAAAGAASSGTATAGAAGGAGGGSAGSGGGGGAAKTDATTKPAPAATTTESSSSSSSPEFTLTP
jgi:hypothetical protein